MSGGGDAALHDADGGPLAAPVPTAAGPLESNPSAGASKYTRLLLALASLLGIGALWWLISLIVDNPLIMPGPIPVIAAAASNFAGPDPTGSTAWEHIAVTMGRILASFVISMIIGTAIGLLMGMSKKAEGLLIVPVTTGLAIPGLCWALLAVMWFGVSEATAVFAIVVVITPFIIVSLWEGAKAVDRDLLGMAAAFHASKRETVRRIYLPHLMPYVFGAVRYAFALAWKIAVVVELFGLSSGVGYILQFWYATFNLTQVMAWTLLFAIIVIAIERYVIGPLRTWTFRWQPEPGTTR